jgi:biopolymer transport protein ExbD
MRNWPSRPERHARIEIIPMIDVMMFLLVFFVMISTNVLPALGLKITPPSTSNADKIIDKTKVTVGIDKEGNTFLDGSPTEISKIASELKLLAADKLLSVVIAGDEGTSLQSLVNVLEILKQAGVDSAKIVTKAR